MWDELLGGRSVVLFLLLALLGHSSGLSESFHLDWYFT